MEWYIPITILPAVGLLVMSTTAQMMGLSTEIGSLLNAKCTPFQHKISGLKIKQLTRLTISTTLLYLASSFFVLSGLISSIHQIGLLSKFTLIIGVGLILIALLVLIYYGFKTILIRKMQHKHNHNNTKKMQLTESIIKFLKNKNKDQASQNPKGLCPNCWGRQEYGGHFFEAVKQQNIDLKDKNPSRGWIQDYVDKNLSEIELHQKEELFICNTCKIGYRQIE